jgi:hypothetical protein
MMRFLERTYKEVNWRKQIIENNNLLCKKYDNKTNQIETQY